MKEWGEDDEEGEEVEKAAAVEPDMEDIKVFHGDGTAVTEDFSHINGIATEKFAEGEARQDEIFSL